MQAQQEADCLVQQPAPEPAVSISEESSSESDQDHFDRAALGSRDVSSQQGHEHRAGSIASTYWRPERRDRNDNLSMIDERWVSSLCNLERSWP